MKIPRVLLCAMGFVATIAVAAPEKTAVPFREITFDEAAKAATAEGKLVFIDFYTTWCGPCKALDAQTWTDAAVGERVGAKTVPLKIDAEKEVALAKRYKIAAYPTLLLVKPDGAEVDRLVGFREPAKFLAEFDKLLATAATGKSPLEVAQGALANADPDDAQPHFALAEQLQRAGKPEEALKELLWCWEEGKKDVEFARTTRTRRVPMMLAALGRELPAAKEALVRLRDQAHDRAVAGKGGSAMIDDLIQLNKALHDDDNSIAVLDQIPAGDRRRHTISIYLFDALVAKKRYADALEAYSLDSLTRMLTRAPSKEITARFGEAQAKAMQHSSVMYAARRVEPLLGLGRIDDAKELAAKVLEADSSDETKTFLHEAATRTGHPELFPEVTAAPASTPPTTSSAPAPTS